MSGSGGCSYKGMSTAVETAYVGVRFGEETNLTLCGTGGELLGKGAGVIVELEGEAAYGRVEQSPMPIFKPCQKASAKTILRPATTDDTQAFEAKLEQRLSGFDTSMGGRFSGLQQALLGRLDEAGKAQQARFATTIPANARASVYESSLMAALNANLGDIKSWLNVD